MHRKTLLEIVWTFFFLIEQFILELDPQIFYSIAHELGLYPVLLLA